MAYSDKVIDHYNNPRNVGQMDKSSRRSPAPAWSSAPECGDVMRNSRSRVNPETQVIEEAKFKTFRLRLSDRQLFAGH